MNALSPPLPLFLLDPPVVYHCILGEDNIPLSINPLSDVSRILASTAYKLNLPSIFDSTSLQQLAVDVKVPTVGGFYVSTLDLIVSYDLPSDIVLGSDCSIPCQPVLIDEPPFFSRPSPDTSGKWKWTYLLILLILAYFDLFPAIWMLQKHQNSDLDYLT